MVYVIANDNDYLQICNSRIKMIKGNISLEAVPSGNDGSCVGERYLIRKILLGDISDTIRACTVNKLLLEKNIKNLNEMDTILEDKVYKTVSKSNIELLLKDDEGYSFFSQLLEAIRTDDIKDATDPRLVLLHNFYQNTVLMDFKMIPRELRKELESRFASYM